MSVSEPCICHVCVREGVSRPAVAPLGQTLHGRELEAWWLAREEFEAAVAKVKQLAKGDVA